MCVVLSLSGSGRVGCITAGLGGGTSTVVVGCAMSGAIESSVVEMLFWLDVDSTAAKRCFDVNWFKSRR